MTLESYLSAFTVFLALGLVVYSLGRRPRSGIPFALVGLTILIWESGFFLVARAAVDSEAWFGYRWASWGFCFTGWATTVFLFREAGWNWRRTLLWASPAGAAGLVFALQSSFGILYVEGFDLGGPVGPGYRIATGSGWFWAFNLTYLVHFGSAVVLAWVSSSQPLRRVRTRGLLLVGLYLTTVLLHIAQSTWGPITGEVRMVHPIIPVNAVLFLGMFAVLSWTEPRTVDAPWVEAKVIDALHDGIAVFDLSGRLIRSNPAWQALAPEPGRWDSRLLTDPEGEAVGTLAQVRRQGAIDSAAHRYLLSDREEQVAVQVLAGRTNKEIAQALSLSEATVKAHLTQVFSKTGARDREELFRWLI